MSQHFQCFIEFNGHKYDFIINEDISSVCFEDIYNKVKQIISLALNEVIDFGSHDFEVFENNSSKGVIIQSFDHFVKHLSSIRISRKSINVCLNYGFIPRVETPNIPFISHPLSSNPVQSNTNDNEFIPHEYYCVENCYKNVDKIDSSLLKKKLNLNFESYKRFSDLFTTLKDIMKSNRYLMKMSEHQWLNEVPNQLSAFGHTNFQPKYWKTTFDTFLKKYIEVMDVSPDPQTACSLFPFFHEFNSFRFDANNDGIDHKKIKKLRERMERKRNEKESNYRKGGIKSKTFRKLVNRLIREEEDIKVFYLIVYLMDSNQVYKKRAQKKWIKVSDSLRKYGFSSRLYSYKVCRELFFNWAAFYAQNYDKLNGNLEPRVQQIFDLLKIVHILDFTNMWSYHNSTHSSLKKIDRKIDDEFLKNLKKKMPDMFDNRKKSKYDTIPDKDLTSVDMDLEDGEVSDDDIKVIENNVNIASTTHSSKALPNRVPLTDPRLNRLNSITNQSINSESMTEKCDNNNTGNIVNVEKESSRSAILSTDFNGDKSKQKEKTSDGKPNITSVPLRDPRLQKSIIYESYSTVISKPTEPTEQTPNCSSKSIPAISQINNNSDVLDKSSAPYVSDQRNESKISDNSSDDFNSNSVSNQNANKIVIKSEPIECSTIFTQPLISLRDPRLKRRLEQQNEEQNKRLCIDSSKVSDK